MPRRLRWKRSEIQSLRFSKDDYTKAQAKAWAKRYRWKYGTVESTDNFWAIPQFKLPRGYEARYFFFPGTKVEGIVAGKPAKKNPLLPKPGYDPAHPRARSESKIAGEALNKLEEMRAELNKVVIVDDDSDAALADAMVLLRHIRDDLDSLYAQARAGYHRNPARVRNGGRPRPGAMGIREMIGLVHSIKYQHAESAEYLEHDFESEPVMYALEGGGLLVEHSEYKLWGDE